MHSHAERGNETHAERGNETRAGRGDETHAGRGDETHEARATCGDRGDPTGGRRFSGRRAASG